MDLIVTLFSIFLTLFTSPWIRQLPLWLIILEIFTILSFLHYLYFGHKYIFYLSFFFLFLAQIFSTRFYNLYQSQPLDNFNFQSQVNSYPSTLSHFSYYFEKYLDSFYFDTFRDYFFKSIDIVDYFKHRFLTILFIPFIVGLSKVIIKSKKIFLYPFAFSILLLGFISPDGLYGPIIIIPFITILISYYSHQP